MIGPSRPDLGISMTTASARPRFRLFHRLAASAIAAGCGLGAALVAPGDAVARDPNDQVFLFRPVLGVSTAGLTMTPRNAPIGGDRHVMEWKPNSSMKIGARTGYGPFLATATVDLAPANPTETHGSSRGLELQFTGAVRVDDHEIAGTVFFQRYQGFYLSSTENLFPRAEGPLLAPRLALTTYGCSLLFFNDPNFSYDDTFVEYRQREKGEFSLGMRLAVGRFSFISGPNALIPAKFEPDFLGAFGLNALDATYASLGLGFGADWRPFGRLLFGASAFIGGTAAATKFRISGYERSTLALGPSISLQLVAGYAGDLFHWGIMSTAEQETLRIEGTDVTADRANALLFVGLTL
jgi:Domain of unknown function (DUF4421)